MGQPTMSFSKAPSPSAPPQYNSQDAPAVTEPVGIDIENMKEKDRPTNQWSPEAVLAYYSAYPMGDKEDLEWARKHTGRTDIICALETNKECRRSVMQPFLPLLFLPCFWPHLIIMSPCICPPMLIQARNLKNTLYIMTKDSFIQAVKDHENLCCGTTGDDFAESDTNLIMSVDVDRAGKGGCSPCKSAASVTVKGFTQMGTMYIKEKYINDFVVLMRAVKNTRTRGNALQGMTANVDASGMPQMSFGVPLQRHPTSPYTTPQTHSMAFQRQQPHPVATMGPPQGVSEYPPPAAYPQSSSAAYPPPPSFASTVHSPSASGGGGGGGGFCTNCGTPQDGKSNFCGNCGTPRT